MSGSLIIYSSTDGHTKKICEQIKNFLDDGDLVELISLDEAIKFDLNEFNKLIKFFRMFSISYACSYYNFIKFD